MCPLKLTEINRKTFRKRADAGPVKSIFCENSFEHVHVYALFYISLSQNVLMVCSVTSERNLVECVLEESSVITRTGRV